MLLLAAAALLTLAVSSLVQAVPTSALRARHLAGVDELKDSYDYVVIGGGTAGMTVGDRLSETGDCEPPSEGNCGDG